MILFTSTTKKHGSLGTGILLTRESWSTTTTSEYSDLVSGEDTVRQLLYCTRTGQLVLANYEAQGCVGHTPTICTRKRNQTIFDDPANSAFANRPPLRLIVIFKLLTHSSGTHDYSALAHNDRNHFTRHLSRNFCHHFSRYTNIRLSLHLFVFVPKPSSMSPFVLRGFLRTTEL